MECLSYTQHLTGTLYVQGMFRKASRVAAEFAFVYVSHLSLRTVTTYVAGPSGDASYTVLVPYIGFHWFPYIRRWSQSAGVASDDLQPALLRLLDIPMTSLCSSRPRCRLTLLYPAVPRKNQSNLNERPFRDPCSFAEALVMSPSAEEPSPIGREPNEAK